MRAFETGATRDKNEDKPHYEGYFSAPVMARFGEYMLANELQADGKRRDPGNWKQGIPLEAYGDSLWRHFMDWYAHHDGHPSLAREDLETSLAGLLFNVQGYLHEVLRGKDELD